MEMTDGKVAIITGAASGFGAAAARLFAADGVRVVVTDVNPAGADVATSIGKDIAAFMNLDVTRSEDWDRVVNDTRERFGRVDALVNNAAVFRMSCLEQTTPEDMDLICNVDIKGTFLGMKAVIPEMRKRGGSVVNISSTAGLRGIPDQWAYASSKWAIRGMSRHGAVELAKDNIRVNCVFPGVMDTPVLQNVTKDMLAILAEMTPIGRLGTPEDVAATVVFLCSDRASFITGGEFAMDGGLGA